RIRARTVTLKLKSVFEKFQAGTKRFSMSRNFRFDLLRQSAHTSNGACRARVAGLQPAAGRGLLLKRPVLSLRPGRNPAPAHCRPIFEDTSPFPHLLRA